MTVMTVFGQSARQLLDLVFELFDLLFERQQFGHLGFERRIFFAQCLQFFFLRHSPTLPGFHCFGKSLAVPNSYRRWKKPDGERFLYGTRVPVLNIRGKC